jgi:hypothetical protein
MKSTQNTTALVRRIVGGTVALALTFGALNLPAPGLLTPAMAHAAPCPYCNMTVSDATASVLRAGRKRVEYKCVYCALSEAKTEYKGDLTITSPSEKAGKPVVMKRTGGMWTVSPATAYFVSPQRLKHKVCQQQARAFSTKAAAQAFAKTSSGMVMTLAQMNAMAR